MTDERGVTSAVEFVLTVAIAAALMSGLIVAASSTVDRQRSLTAQQQMEIVGQQVAGSIESADRQVRLSASVTTLRSEQDLPERVLRSDYAIEVTASTVVITSSATDRAVQIPFDSTTSVTPTTVEGGDIVVTYGGSDLEVDDA